MIIAIDGPSGAGKSTVAKKVASKLGFVYLDTGAMYRAVALNAQSKHLTLDNEAEIINLARSAELKFEGNPFSSRIYLNGKDVSEEIRTPEISNFASAISAIPDVRKVLVDQQRKIGTSGRIVTEGRDQSTVVFPHAKCKIFLTASPEERARRRALELNLKGMCVSYEAILEQQIERDNRDSTRLDSPLRIAKDAHVIDSDGLSFEQVVEKVLEICRK